MVIGIDRCAFSYLYSSILMDSYSHTFPTGSGPRPARLSHADTHSLMAAHALARNAHSRIMGGESR